MGERQRRALADSQPQKGFGQRAVQVLAELQVNGVAGCVGQGQNGQSEAPSRDWHIEPAPFEEPFHRGERVANCRRLARTLIGKNISVRRANGTKVLVF
jgi:hypothetical protein